MISLYMSAIASVIFGVTGFAFGIAYGRKHP